MATSGKLQPKNGSWNALIPSTAAEAVALRANELLTNWVNVEETVRADPEPGKDRSLDGFL